MTLVQGSRVRADAEEAGGADELLLFSGLTGKSQATVFVATSRYQICFEGYPKMLKPSLNFVATVRVHLCELCFLFPRLSH